MAAVLEGLYVARDNKALLVARSGTIVSINALAAQLVGEPADEIIGKRALADLFHEPAVSETAASSGLARWETTLHTASGTLVPIEVVREPLGTRLTGTLVYAVRDLRERQEAAAERERKNRALEQRERELSIQNLRFDTAINNMPQGLAMFDAARQLLVCNARFGELLALSPGQRTPGMPLQQLLMNCTAAPDGPTDDTREASARTTAIGLDNGAVLLCAGRQLSVSSRPMPDGGLVVTTEDITERERDKRRLQDYTEKLEASNQELQSFAYVASHDLQEPLRKIETFVDRIMSRGGDDLPPGIATPLERVQDAARRMRILINDLLAYARLNKETKPFAPVCLNGILRGVLSDLQIRIEETGAEVLSNNLPTLDADATQMRQLLQNLLSNALKFSRQGIPPVIRLQAEIRRSAGAQEQVALVISDNGIGFDNRHKDQIFKIFQRLHSRSEYEGTGVGLATCRRIVERHHGSIDAEGRPGEGATFTILLPIHHPPAL